MIARHALATLALATIIAAAAPSFAQSAMQQATRAIATTTASSLVASRPQPGLVPLRIDVTQPRRVMVRDASTHGLTEVCTTPCRIYVRPGRIDVTLVGWNAHEYHWDVPEQGGSMHLLARLPGGQLDTMPAESAPPTAPIAPPPPSAVAQSPRPAAPTAPLASTNDLATARIHAAFGFGAVAAAVGAMAHGVALTESSNVPST
jgi:hypothetical protein